MSSEHAFSPRQSTPARGRQTADDLVGAGRFATEHVTRQVRGTCNVVLAGAGRRAVDRAHATDARAVRAPLVAQVARVGRRRGVTRNGGGIGADGHASFGAARNTLVDAVAALETDLTGRTLVRAGAANGAIAQDRLVAAGRADHGDVGEHHTDQPINATHRLDVVQRQCQRAQTRGTALAAQSGRSRTSCA